MIILGLTGSIGMGKSTTAAMFRAEGIGVHDSDAAVHALYAGAAAPLIEKAFPGTTHDGLVDRQKLGELVLGDPQAIKTLEGIIHPLVHASADRFLGQQERSGAKLAVLDIPLLFETGGEGRVDKIVVVTASPEIQRERVLSREGMTQERFATILNRQMPDEEKRKRADFIIDTGKGMDAARAEVRHILAELGAMAPLAEDQKTNGQGSGN